MSFGGDTGTYLHVLFLSACHGTVVRRGAAAEKKGKEKIEK
jgi:hypothetical protein